MASFWDEIYRNLSRAEQIRHNKAMGNEIASRAKGAAPPGYPGNLVPSNINRNVVLARQNFPGADQYGRSIRQSRNAFGKPNMGYENFTPPTVNYGMNAFGQTTKQKTANEKQARFDNATKIAAALALQEQNAARTSVTPPGQPSNYQSDRYDYGGPGQGITSRNSTAALRGPWDEIPPGKLSWLARNSRVPTKEQYDLAMLDPRTRMNAAKVVQNKQNFSK